MHRHIAILPLVVAAVLTGCNDPPPPVNPGFDFSAMAPFWEVHDSLTADREPSTEEWAALLNSPGYRALTRSEFTNEFFQESFRLALMPSRKDEFETALADERQARFLRHYVDVSRRRDELERHLEHLQSSSIVAPIIQRTQEYLPPVNVEGSPQVAFVIFANDGRAYEPIVIDLLASISWDIESFLAHEFHHWYRNRLRILDFSQADPADADLLWTLNQIQAEGIADLIDKRPWVLEGASPPQGAERYAEIYRQNLEATPELLKTLDGLLVQYSGPPERRAAIGAQVRDLIPQSGHPTGFYMAALISSRLGHAALIEDLGNPFAFVRAFNEAATQAGRPSLKLSDTAMAVLNDLEQQHLESQTALD
jgi:hypothetical protein